MNTRGFTIIELVVVSAIIGVVASVVLMGNSSFNRSILVSQGAHSVSATIRKAQNLSYGFHIAADATPTTPSYLIFQDVYPADQSCIDGDMTVPGAQPGNCRYDSWYTYDSTELVKEFHTPEGVSVTRFCVDDGSVCSGSGGTDLFSLDIVFSRVNSRAVILGRMTNEDVYQYYRAIIHVAAANGVERCVVVEQSGQISTPQTCP